MSLAGWIAWGLVAVGYVGIFLALRSYRRELEDVSADLDETNSVVDRILDHLNDAPSDGRHAADSPSTSSSQTVH